MPREQSGKETFNLRARPESIRTFRKLWKYYSINHPGADQNDFLDRMLEKVRDDCIPEPFY